MSFRHARISIGSSLVLAAVIAVSAIADAQEPRVVVIDGQEYVIIDGQRIPTHVAERGQDKSGDQPRRVEVRDLRKADGPTAAEQIQTRTQKPRRELEAPYWWRYPVYARHGAYYGPARRPAARELADAYRARRYELRKEEEHLRARQEMAERKQRILTQHERALRSGVQLLQTGEPQRAVVALTMAAKLNHGDPACRVHLAQARLALGHYREAAWALRRGLELQPKLIYLDLHLEEYYADADLLRNYTDKLGTWVDQTEPGWEAYFLLGFFEFQRGEFEAAHEAFARVAAARPKDELAQSYLEITRPLEVGEE